jgi:hypothetical protein
MVVCGDWCVTGAAHGAERGVRDEKLQQLCVF